MTEFSFLSSGLEAMGVAVENNPQPVEQLLAFSKLLVQANEVMNLTAITDPMEIITRHFLDCASLVPAIAPHHRVLDVGTGAGFPGLPLAILTKGNFMLMDALQKRVDFLNNVIRELGLTNVTAIHARAEDYIQQGREAFDVVTSRAVADLRVLTELSLPYIKLGGYFYAMKADNCGEEVESAENAILALGGTLEEVRKYQVPNADVTRSIVVMKKVTTSPEKYPRRFSKIQSKPL